MINIKTLFNKTLDEIDEKIANGNEYNILMLAALIRKLLIDGENSLIHQIDKKGQKLEFYANVRKPLHERMPTIFKNRDLTAYMWFAENGLNPDTANKRNGFNPKLLNLDEFLGLAVIYVKGQKITVRDLIKHMSDKEGAVHKQKQPLSLDEIKNILLKELADYIDINSIAAGLNTLKAIAIIVKRDLSKFKH